MLSTQRGTSACKRAHAPNAYLRSRQLRTMRAPSQQPGSGLRPIYTTKHLPLNTPKDKIKQQRPTETRRLRFFGLQARHYARARHTPQNTAQEYTDVSTDAAADPLIAENTEASDGHRQGYEPIPLQSIFKVFAVVTPPNYFLPVR